jgi:hypothetical protein
MRATSENTVSTVGSVSQYGFGQDSLGRLWRPLVVLAFTSGEALPQHRHGSDYDLSWIWEKLGVTNCVSDRSRCVPASHAKDKARQPISVRP